MHLAVLLKEVINELKLRPGHVVLDATTGGAGHAREILKRIIPGGKLIAVDRDPEAIERAKGVLKDFVSEVIYVNDDFRNIDKILAKVGIEKINGALFDLGISSFQLDDSRRGFSFLKDGPLDMRFNQKKGISASDVVNDFKEEQLIDIIKKYGEERYSRRIAAAILQARLKKRIEATGELVDIVLRTVGSRYRTQALHPACRTFQALRIYVNDELGAMEEAINKTIPYLENQGRICVISFHSLEDRIVKNIFRDMARHDELSIITKKPIIPAKEELRANPRSRSAKMRVAEKRVVI